MKKQPRKGGIIFGIMMGALLGILLAPRKIIQLRDRVLSMVMGRDIIETDPVVYGLSSPPQKTEPDQPKSGHLKRFFKKLFNSHR